jgi:hypothetical protein
MRQTLPCCLLVLLGAGIETACLQGAAPPPTPRWLASELRKAEKVEASLRQAALAGNFAEALRLSRQALRARCRLQGPRHPQAIDAALWAERLAGLAALPAARQRLVGAAWRKDAEGQEHLRKGRFARAEKLFREALPLSRQALGEEHPDITRGYNNLAACLDGLGRPAEAQSL